MTTKDDTVTRGWINEMQKADAGNNSPEMQRLQEILDLIKSLKLEIQMLKINVDMLVKR